MKKITQYEKNVPINRERERERERERKREKERERVITCAQLLK